MNNIIPAQQGEHWEIIDVGLEINRSENHQFWHRGEIVQGYTVISGFQVTITKHSGRMGWKTLGAMFSVGINGNVHSCLTEREAIAILDNIRTPIGDYIDAECED